jgi:hypothetical protein
LEWNGNMNADELYRKLIAAARATAPDETVPYAFEKRILARLTSQPIVDRWTFWARALWRATAPCLAIVLLLSIWTMMSNSSNSSLEPLGKVLENTLVAGLHNPGDSW